MRSSIALAVGLAIVHSSSARVANEATTEALSSSSGSVINWFGRLFRRNAQITCFQDEYYDFTAQRPFGERFCRAFMEYPVITATVETTPVTTTTDVYSTVLVTKQEVVHTTIVTTASTVTITPTPIGKRDAALDVDAIFQGFRRQKEELNMTIDTPQMSASFSSACDCQTWAGTTSTATVTNSGRVLTISAFERDTITITSFQTDAIITATATMTAPTPTPTAPVFNCPADNDSTVSQLIGNERFDYLILCDTDLNDRDFYNVLSYSSFSECAAACSIANAQFDSPVCQGLSYYSSDSASNCFLKGTANNSMPALGVDSALLQRIAVGLTDDTPVGTNTESAPFVGETQTLNPGQLSSSFSSFIGNSSTSIPVITPGPALGSGRPVLAGETSYSTYISDGSTYSSGTVFSSYFSANGSWYYTYYTAFTQSWVAATTVYASSDFGSMISNTSNTEVSTQPGENGEYYTITNTTTFSLYPGGYNATEIVSNVTIAQNGTQLASTAVTSYYSVETGGSGGTSGGSGAGGIGQSGAGIITGTGVTSKSVFSTFTIFSGGGQTGGFNGGAGSGVVQTPAPSVTIVSGGTAFSSGFAASGIVSVVSGAASGAGSGMGLSSDVPLSAISSTVNIGGTAFSSGFGASGGGGGAGGANSTAVSGAILSSATGFPRPLISFTTRVGATAFSSGFVASGVVSDATGASSTALSGVISTSGVPSFSGSPPMPIFSTRTVTGSSDASSTAASGGSPSTNSNGDRTGTLSISPSTSSLPLSLRTGSFNGTSPASSTVPVMITQTQSVPLPSGPIPYNFVPFTNSFGLRTYIPSGSSVPSGFVMASTLLSNGSSFSGSGLALTGSAPTAIPVGTGGLPSSASSGSNSSGIRPAFSTGTAPTFLPLGAGNGSASSGFAFANSQLPRTGSLGISTGTVPASVSPPYPTGARSCVPSYLGTTTIFTTVTQYGCYSNCPPQGTSLTFGS